MQVTKRIVCTFTFADGAVATPTASFERSQLCEAKIQYGGASERIAALIGRSLPSDTCAECHHEFLGQYDDGGVRITTTEEGEWREMFREIS